jgi:hypothetical protein
MVSWTPGQPVLPALLMMTVVAGGLASVSDLAAQPGASRARVAPAWRGVVLVLSPEGEQDELTRDALVRISGELGAALFQVVSRPVDPAVDLMVQVETVGADLGPVAAFAIVRDANEGAGGIAVWVSNRMTRMTTVQHVRLSAGAADRAATQLAVETVELLRANIVGVKPEPAPSATAATGLSGLFAGEAGAGAPRFGLAVGVGLFHDLGSVPASWAPAVALSYGRPDRLELRLLAIGLGPGTEVTIADGSGARLQRQLLSVGAVHWFRSDRRIQFLLSAAGGGHRLGADGTGAPADREHSRSAFSAVLSAGGGGAWALGPHLALTVEAEGLFLWPTATVRVGSSDAGHLHRPSVFAHGSLRATF